MGHDPESDWLTPPFHRDRNSLLVAAEGGFGTVELKIDRFQSEVQGPVGQVLCILTRAAGADINCGGPQPNRA